MKTIIVPVDFSKISYGAARYAIELALATNASVTLCHAFIVPQETPVAAQIAWPLDDYETLKKDATHELEQMRDQLIQDAGNGHQFPLMTIESEAGPLNEVLANIIGRQQVMLVVMGMSGVKGIDHFLFGSHTKELIESAKFPLLLVPPKAKFNGLTKIVFASDLHRGDSVPFSFLAEFGRFFQAELVVAHITHQKQDDPELTDKIRNFMAMLTDKTQYPELSYSHIDSLDTDHGLDWLAEHDFNDMVAIVHRKHSLWYKLFKGSHTRKLAEHIQIPLLVFPEN